MESSIIFTKQISTFTRKGLRMFDLKYLLGNIGGTTSRPQATQVTLQKYISHALIIAINIIPHPIKINAYLDPSSSQCQTKRMLLILIYKLTWDLTKT